MTRLAWGAPAERLFETGLDQGVLYPPNASGVVWNGLRSVTDSAGDIEVNSYYLSGIKYLDTRSDKDYSGTIKALTYPDEFAMFDGFSDGGFGLVVPDQPVNSRFGLCYRTLIGNDVEDTDFGYKIHLLYNLIAKPDDVDYQTASSDVNPIEFSWTITGKPVLLEGFRPSVHYIIDTRKSDYYRVDAIEDLLYGSDAGDPYLPDINDVLTILGEAAIEPVIFDGGLSTQSETLVLDGGSV